MFIHQKNRQLFIQATSSCGSNEQENSQDVFLFQTEILLILYKGLPTKVETVKTTFIIYHILIKRKNI